MGTRKCAKSYPTPIDGQCPTSHPYKAIKTYANGDTSECCYKTKRTDKSPAVVNKGTKKSPVDKGTKKSMDKKVAPPADKSTKKSKDKKTAPPPDKGTKKSTDKKVADKGTKKNTEQSIKSNIQSFRKHGASFLAQSTENTLSEMIRAANKAYHCYQEPLLTDQQYDILCEFVKNKFPNNTAILEGHTQCKPSDARKVKLPYELWSMDKIKPETGALEKWKTKYTGPYCISTKVDGVSALYTTEGSVPRLYTRGSAVEGQDISHLIPFLKLPQDEGITIRGEIIMKKAIFDKKYKMHYKNPRNMVAGLVNNRKNPDISRIRDLSYVAYEVIKPHLRPSKQFKLLKGLNVSVVKNTRMEDITNETLSNLLLKWRKEYPFEIDGIICSNNARYPRKSGNPEHSFAFKMILSDQIAETRVIEVLWAPSKDGYLKPRVHVEPIKVDGVSIEYANGFNAKNIIDKKIGVGAVVSIVRSGGVIPDILNIIQPAEAGQLPDVDYVWSDSGVDIMLSDIDTDATVRLKTITRFFKGIGVEGMGEGIIQRIVDAGFDDIHKILSMSEKDFLKVASFGAKRANTCFRNIKEKIETVALPDLMHATNIFGRGFGSTRLKAILDAYPNILLSHDSDETMHRKVSSVEGLADLLAKRFVDKKTKFIDWIHKAGLDDRLKYTVLVKHVPSEAKAHPLFNKKIVMTGFRDKKIIELINSVGATLSNAVSKKGDTYILIVKRPAPTEESMSTKEKLARELGVTIMGPEAFMQKYFA